MSKGMILALCVSILLAVSLSLLPERALQGIGGGLFGPESGQRDVAVAKMTGLVDGLNGLSLTSHLQKVTFEGERLTVWLAVPSRALQGGRPYDDIYKIAHRFLVEGGAYKQVEVKVVAAERPGGVLLRVLADTADMTQAPVPGSGQGGVFVRERFDVVEPKNP